MQIKPLKKRKKNQETLKLWENWDFLQLWFQAAKKTKEVLHSSCPKHNSSLWCSVIDIYQLLSFQLLWRLPCFLFSTSRTKKEKIILLFQPTYFRVKARNIWSCDCWSPLTPRYRSLSKRPGLKRAGSRRSGRFVAPITNTSQALWRPSSSANNCDTTLTKRKSSVTRQRRLKNWHALHSSRWNKHSLTQQVGFEFNRCKTVLSLCFVSNSFPPFPATAKFARLASPLLLQQRQGCECIFYGSRGNSEKVQAPPARRRLPGSVV